MVRIQINALRRFFLPEGDRLLGLAHEKHHYDLPLDKNGGTGFLMTLIALMAFLAAMALGGIFVLNGVGARWSSGLENKVTVEIPAQIAAGKPRNRADIEKIQDKIQESLSGRPFVRSVEPMDEADVRALVAPWLGEGAALGDMPMPGLVALEFSQVSTPVLGAVRGALAEIDPGIILDTHEEWLADLLRLTGGLRSVAILIALVIGATAVISVAGAVRARMAIHREDVELLHLMGARDRYITKQFQRHAVIIALKGSAAGAAAGIVVLWSLGTFSGVGPDSLLPQGGLGLISAFWILCLPLAACGIAAGAARFTVLRTLQAMP